MTNFLSNATPIVRSAPLLWALVAIGVLALMKKGLPKQCKLFLMGYAVFSFLSICPGFYFRPHYFLLLLPCAGILVGSGVTAVTTSAKGILSNKLQHTFIADIEKKDPRYILFVNVPTSWLRRPVSPHSLNPRTYYIRITTGDKAFSDKDSVTIAEGGDGSYRELDLEGGRVLFRDEEK